MLSLFLFFSLLSVAEGRWLNYGSRSHTAPAAQVVTSEHAATPSDDFASRAHTNILSKMAKLGPILEKISEINPGVAAKLGGLMDKSERPASFLQFQTQIADIADGASATGATEFFSFVQAAKDSFDGVIKAAVDDTHESMRAAERVLLGEIVDVVHKRAHPETALIQEKKTDPLVEEERLMKVGPIFAKLAKVDHKRFGALASFAKTAEKTGEENAFGSL